MSKSSDVQELANELLAVLDKQEASASHAVQAIGQIISILCMEESKGDIDKAYRYYDAAKAIFNSQMKFVTTQPGIAALYKEEA